jgi:hypothetical protein
MKRSDLQEGRPFLIMRRHAEGHVSNAIDVEEFDHPGVWGVVLADCVQHLVNAYVSQGMDSITVRQAILSSLAAELDEPTEKAHRVELEDE